MPVSEERVAQIRVLCNGERIDRLDPSRFDGAAWQRLDAEMDEEADPTSPAGGRLMPTPIHGS
jgi:hypothetical protein